MTTTIRTQNRFSLLPKNKTGLFAADTLSDAKPTRQNFVNVPNFPASSRAALSFNNFLTSNPDFDSTQNGSSSNDANLSKSRIRNGFSSAKVRHPNFRLFTATNQKSTEINEVRTNSTRKPFVLGQGSVRLKSEIDQINSQLKRHAEPNKNQRNNNAREIDPTIQSVMSFATSCRISSASTNFGIDRIHQRFSSAVTSGPMENCEPVHNFPLLPVTPAMTLNETIPQLNENAQSEQTHAYQIPQQSNVGSESIFTCSSMSSQISSKSNFEKRGSPRSGRSRWSNNRNRSAVCPFYVLYLSNLASQQRKTSKELPPNETQQIPIGNLGTTRKVNGTSRSTTANIAQTSVRRPVNSPLSINTYSTGEEDDYLTATSFSTMQKRASARTTQNDRENRSSFNEILRTSSMNPIEV